VSAESNVSVLHRGPAVQLYSRSDDQSSAPSLSPTSVVVGQELEMVMTVIVPEGTARDAELYVSFSNTDVIDPASVSLVSVVGPSSGSVRVVCGSDPERDVSALGEAGNFAVDPSSGLVRLGPCTMTNNDTDNGVLESVRVVVRGVVSSNASRSVRGASTSVTGSIASSDIQPPVGNGSVVLTIVEPSMSVPSVRSEQALVDVDGGDSVFFNVSINHTSVSDSSAFRLVLGDAGLVGSSGFGGTPAYSLGRVWVNGIPVSSPGNPADGLAEDADAILYVPELGVGDALEVRFELLLSSSVESGSNYSLPDVTLRWRSSPVSLSEGRNYSASVSEAQELSVLRPSVSLFV